MALLTKKQRYNKATKRKYASIYEKIPFKISKNIVFELKAAVFTRERLPIYFDSILAVSESITVIKEGIMCPDDDSICIGGWQGIISDIEDDGIVEICWDSITLKQLPHEYHYCPVELEQFKFSCTGIRYGMDEYISYGIKTAGCQSC